MVDLLCLLNMRCLTTLKISVKGLSRLFPPLDKIYLSLDKFWFENGNIDSQNAVGIFRALEHNTSLKKLDLSENSQLTEGDSEAVGYAIERMLNVNRTLKVLKLSSCELDTAVATSIFRSLQYNTSLEELDLSENNQLGDSEAVGYAIERMLNVNKTLGILNLSSCELDTAVGTSIFRSLQYNTSLEELDLSENRQLAEDDSEAVGSAIERTLKVNRKLRVLNLHGCGITDPIAKHILTGLMNSTSLVTLDIEPCTLGVCCAVSLLTHPTVRNIVDEVNILGVGRMKMDKGTIRCDNSLGSVFYFSSDRLRCQSGNIDSQNAVDIFRSLEQNTTLRELDISENSQLAKGNSEAVGCAIEKILNVNRTLKSLNLSGCGVTDPIVQHILTGLTNTSLVTLDMGSPKLSGSCTVSLFQQMTTHPTLSITVGVVTVLGVGRVKMDRGYLYIWCLASHVIPENCVELFRALNNSGLKILELNAQYLINQAAEHFAVGLAECQSVQALKFQHCYISSAGVVTIFRSLEYNTSLEELDLSGNSQLAEGDSEAVGSAIERMLNVNRTLKLLNLNGCNVTDPIVKHILTGLTKNTSLETLHMRPLKLSGTCAVSLFQQMTTHPTLSITVGLAESQSVQVLKLRPSFLGKKSISSAGAVSVFRTLMHNTSLKELDLSWNSQLAEGDSEAVGCAIERMLNVNTEIKVLNLKCCRLTNEVAFYFANGLAQNQSVNKVSFHSNNIGSTGAVSIFRSLEHNTSVEELDLSGNSKLVESYSGAVGCAIERMLNVNTKIKVLNLKCCRLTNEVAFYFANGLAQNQSVNKVSFHSNNIGSTGAVSIFRSLERNTSLEELDLSENSQLAEGDSEAVGCASERMLNVNKTLKVLNLSGCNITDPVVKHILIGLMKNTSLVTLDMGSPTLSGSCVVSLFQQMTTHPTLRRVHVGEVYVLGVGRVEMDRGCLYICIMDNLIPENTVELFRALNNSGLKMSELNAQYLTDQTAEHFAIGLAECQSVQALKLKLKLSNISNAGAVSIFRSLEHNTCLEKLDLSENRQLAEGDSEAVGCELRGC